MNRSRWPAAARSRPCRPVGGARNPEYRRPARCRCGRVADLDRQPGQPPRGCSGAAPSRPGPPSATTARGRPVQRHDRAGNVLGVQVGAGDVRQVGRPDHPHAEPRRAAGGPRPGQGPGRSPCSRRRRRAAPDTGRLWCPPGRRHHLNERVPRREHRVGQAELAHPGIVEGLRPAERLAAAHRPPARSRAPPGPPGAGGVRSAHPHNKTFLPE